MWGQMCGEVDPPLLLPGAVLGHTIKEVSQAWAPASACGGTLGPYSPVDTLWVPLIPSGVVMDSLGAPINPCILPTSWVHPLGVSDLYCAPQTAHHILCPLPGASQLPMKGAGREQQAALDLYSPPLTTVHGPQRCIPFVSRTLWSV